MFQILIFALLAGHSMADDFVYTWATDFLNAGEVTGPIMLTNCIVPPKVSNDTTGNPVGELQNVRTLNLSESAFNSHYITSTSHSSDDAIQDRGVYLLIKVIDMLNNTPNVDVPLPTIIITTLPLTDS